VSIIPAKVLSCDPKGHGAFLRILSTEGRGVRLCWEHSKLKDLNVDATTGRTSLESLRILKMPFSMRNQHGGLRVA